MIRGMQEREREVLVKVRHREAGFHTLLQALQHRMQLLEVHLVEAQRAAGLPVSIPPPPPNLGGLLSVGFVESAFGGSDVTDLSILDVSNRADASIASELKEELDKAIPPHEPLDTSAARSRADLASRGGMALRQSPSQGLIRRSGGGMGGGASVSSTSSLEHSFIEESSRLEQISLTESAGNRSQDESQHFHEIYFTSSAATATITSNSSSGATNRSQTVSSRTQQQQQQQQQQIYSSSQQQQQQYYHHQQQLQQHHYHHNATTVSSSITKTDEMLGQATTTQAAASYYHEHQHYGSNGAGYPNQQPQPQPRPQQHVNDQLKHLIAEREYLRENAIGAEAMGPTARLQPVTSSNRSLGRAPEQQHRAAPMVPPHQTNVFYPVANAGDSSRQIESQLRSSMRTTAPGSGNTQQAMAQPTVNSGMLQRSGSSGAMTESMSSSVMSISSTSSSSHALHQWSVEEWNVEQVGSWLRSIGRYHINFIFYSNLDFDTICIYFVRIGHVRRTLCSEWSSWRRTADDGLCTHQVAGATTS